MEHLVHKHNHTVVVLTCKLQVIIQSGFLLKKKKGSRKRCFNKIKLKADVVVVCNG